MSHEKRESEMGLDMVFIIYACKISHRKFFLYFLMRFSIHASKDNYGNGKWMAGSQIRLKGFLRMQKWHQKKKDRKDSFETNFLSLKESQMTFFFSAVSCPSLSFPSLFFQHKIDNVTLIHNHSIHSRAMQKSNFLLCKN